MDRLSGAVERITSYYPESGHTVLSVAVMPVVSQNYTMLERNLLYTAVTRARKLCALTGNRPAISMAVHNNKATQRFTALEWRLQGGEKMPTHQ